MEMEGVKRILLLQVVIKFHSEDGTFKPEFIQKIQSDVDKANMQFAKHVSKYTGLSVKRD